MSLDRRSGSRALVIHPHLRFNASRKFRELPHMIDAWLRYEAALVCGCWFECKAAAGLRLLLVYTDTRKAVSVPGLNVSAAGTNVFGFGTRLSIRKAVHAHPCYTRRHDNSPPTYSPPIIHPKKVSPGTVHRRDNSPPSIFFTRPI